MNVTTVLQYREELGRGDAAALFSLMLTSSVDRRVEKM